MESTVSTLKTINKCISDNNNILNKYLMEINENMDNPEEFNEILHNLDKNITFDNNTLHFKEIIINILKSFMICNKRIEIGDDLQNKLYEQATLQINDKNLTIESLKKYILQYQQLLKENKIELPKFKPLNLSLQSNLKTNNAISKRLKLLNLYDDNDENSSENIKKWIENLEKNKLTNVPNELIKEAAKEKNIKIKVNKNEQNKLMKN